jgi:hypothetical protein
VARLSTKIDVVASKTSVDPGGEPPNVLAELRQLTKERSELERREAVLVRRARNEGFVWEQISSSLNVSRQAVHKKHAGGLMRRS